MFEKYVDGNFENIVDVFTLKIIARIVDGSEFDEFKKLYGETLVTGK
jgi:3-methylcrotonyl-CoA carboxylase beta subunit